MSSIKEKILNHERHNHIRFYEDEHEYYYYPSGDFRKTSERQRFYGVTSWMSQYTDPFDAKKIATGCSKNPNSEYFGMEVQDILDLWKSKTKFGTQGHKALESNINDGVYEDKWGPMLDAFWEYMDEYELTPIFSEMLIYDEDVNRASAIDILCVDANDKLVIVDAKFFEKGMVFSPYGGKTFNHPLTEIPESKYDKVSLQTSIYRTMLEKNYVSSEDISDTHYVFCVSNEGAELIPTLDYREYAEILYKRG